MELPELVVQFLLGQLTRRLPESLEAIRVSLRCLDVGWSKAVRLFLVVDQQNVGEAAGAALVAQITRKTDFRAYLFSSQIILRS